MKRDEDLFLDGGDAAMNQLVGRYERPLFCFLLQMVGDSHLAEDIFQETFLRLHRSRASYQSSQPLKPYLYRIATAMKVPVSTAKSRMLYALRRLRPILESYRPTGATEKL
ncbi:MAG: sigma factor [Planctomycetota bacterium]